MYEIKQVKLTELLPIIQEMFSLEGKAWISVSGGSMYPFLREGKDSVELSRAAFEAAKKGDLVLIQRSNGQYVLHRVLRKEKSGFYIMGDAQKWVEGPLTAHQLIAAVKRVKRGKRIIRCDSPIWKALSFIWLHVIPFRYVLIRIAGFLSRGLNRGRFFVQ